jgi:hypothetical protein
VPARELITKSPGAPCVLRNEGRGALLRCGWRAAPLQSRRCRDSVAVDANGELLGTVGARSSFATTSKSACPPGSQAKDQVMNMPVRILSASLLALVANACQGGDVRSLAGPDQVQAHVSLDQPRPAAPTEGGPYCQKHGWRCKGSWPLHNFGRCCPGMTCRCVPEFGGGPGKCYYTNEIFEC